MSGILFVYPVSTIANEDFTPSVRSESEIMVQLQWIAAQINRVQALLLASVSTTPAATFVISVDGEVMLNQSAASLSKEAALEQCHEVAYDAANMWQMVSCVNDEEVFVAG